MPRQLFLLLIIVVMVGCSGESPPPPQVQPPPATFAGHVLAADTEYYIDGPQQARPPDGTLKAGVKVRVIEEAGSYCRVQSEDGTLVFISADAISSLSASDSQAAP